MLDFCLAIVARPFELNIHTILVRGWIAFRRDFDAYWYGRPFDVSTVRLQGVDEEGFDTPLV